MISLIQRVSSSNVVVDNEEIAKIGSGLLVFAGIFSDDEMKDLEYCAKKITEIRVFEDDDGNMNKSIADVSGEILLVSQFTLCARVRKGRRPSFDKAMRPEKAKEMFDIFVKLVSEKYPHVQKGSFGAHMEIGLINNGPVTINIDSREKR